VKTTAYFEAARLRDDRVVKIKYFEDTDTLLIELKSGPVSETRDLDENTLLELDDQGRVLAITIEHATERTGLKSSSFDRLAA